MNETNENPRSVLFPVWDSLINESKNKCNNYCLLVFPEKYDPAIHVVFLK